MNASGPGADENPFSFAQLPPLTLYVHVPWCLRKCPYCDFNSHALRGPLPEDAYLQALLRDLDMELPCAAQRPLQSIFFGGGSPSLLAPATLETILTGVRTRFTLAPDIEVTLEANPGTIDARRFDEFRAVGITRLSIGIQSFHSPLLQQIGRVHDAGEALRAARAAEVAGFTDFNLDLMFGLPGQTLQEAAKDVETALALAPTHISYYQLTVEPNTPFHRHPPTLPQEDLIWNMESTARLLLIEAGYVHYEVSAWARPGSECRHNLNYWRFGDYIGIGAGAHSKLTELPEARIRRWSKPKRPGAYLREAGTRSMRRGMCSLTPRDARMEFMMNALRLRGGFSRALYSERTGLAFATAGPLLCAAKVRGLVEEQDGVIRATKIGLRFLNDLLEIFALSD
jgi:putative oxygen-independent coproporphyrinogen III oxidase